MLATYFNEQHILLNKGLARINKYNIYHVRASYLVIKYLLKL